MTTDFILRLLYGLAILLLISAAATSSTAAELNQQTLASWDDHLATAQVAYARAPEVDQIVFYG